MNVYAAPNIERPAHMVVINTLILIPLSYLFVFSGRLKYKDVVQKFFAYSTPILCLIAATMFLMEPQFADRLAKEDDIVEYLTAIFSLLAALITLGLAVYLVFKKKLVLAAVAGILFVGFFVIGMEEISWMQRILNVETPEYFRQNNLQGEVNFHNFDTALTMTLFFIATFTFFVVTPIFADIIKRLLKKIKVSGIAVFIPSEWLALPVLMSLAFAQAGFSTKLHHTIMVVFTIMVLCKLLFAASEEDKNLRAPIYVGLFVFSFVALALGLQDPIKAGIRPWAVDEYREFFLCLTILIYALELPIKTSDYVKIFYKKDHRLKKS